MKKIKTAILGIDLQNDFTNNKGPLFVNGADLDSVRIASFIDKYRSSIDYIALTLDSHKPIHISSQQYWKDREGYPPSLYSIIRANDVANGVWIPQFHKDKAIPYLEKLESMGEVNTIWPKHCIVGDSGWAVNSMIMNSVYMWSVKENKGYDLYCKGLEEWIEQYSIFSMLDGFESDEGVKTALSLLNRLKDFDRILVVGEAADVCVINSLTDLLRIEPLLAQKLVVMTDCMSWISPDNERAGYLFETLKSKGVRFVTSEKYHKLDTV